jgi:hypothetical protein
MMFYADVLGIVEVSLVILLLSLLLVLAVNGLRALICTLIH